uniref:Lipase domain-containing protein n=1 Tax=Branchiostoma floridae TaxID=7739 RepID=C3YCM8_BRAFL|eukprot:XP_002605819.1 hypothetical protein BRAFLDRAFT_84304 [Branchiostoma floridae]
MVAGRFALLLTFLTASYPMLGEGHVLRETGLDPAGPWFKSADAEDRLDRGDAMFVDVIHTDMKWWGKREPMGHVDFYPNEGWNQPGCGRFTLGCSHGRAYELYTESIISSGCQFSAYNCSNWQTFSKNRANCDVCDHSSLTNGMYSDMEPAVANITAPNPNCGPEDIPVILEYIGDGKYDTVIERAADKCPVSTSDGDVTLPSATLVIALQFIVMSLCGAARMGLS